MITAADSRWVHQTHTSKREVEECFGLSVEDIQELRPPRFRGTARLGAAVQLVMLRATGRHPDAFSGLPSVLLRYLHSARMEYRRKQHGVGIYVHMLDTWALFHDQPIVINDRQAAPAVHGVAAHNRSRRQAHIRLSLLAVDTHGIAR